MKKEKMLIRNMGENLDALMNIDPVCLGISSMIYPKFRELAGGEPISTYVAEKMMEIIQPGDTVMIVCGFILRKHNRAEMDGFLGALVMARALIEAFDAKPIILTPEISFEAMKKCVPVAGMCFYDTIEESKNRAYSVTGFSFPTDTKEAEIKAEEILKNSKPKAFISMEAATGNEKGIYHMAAGWDVTELEAKWDVLFNKIKENGIPTIAFGDCGNELGMGVAKEYIKEHVPGAGEGQCLCPCQGGVAAATAADYAVIGRAADYGVYAVIAALAYLKKNLNIFHSGELEGELMKCAARNGMITTNGSLTPALDGLGVEYNVLYVELMRQVVRNGLEIYDERWINKFISVGYLEKDSNKKIIIQ